MTLAVAALKKTTSEPLSADKVEISVAPSKKKEFSLISEKEVEKHLK